MMTDPIADMLTRIRNAQAARKSDVAIPYSRMKLGIAELLHHHGFVGTVETIPHASGTPGFSPTLHIMLKYDGDKKPAITTLNRISKPGRRWYSKAAELPVVLNNLGIAIISTPEGLMTNKDAKRKKLGGEVVCEVW